MRAAEALRLTEMLKLADAPNPAETLRLAENPRPIKATRPVQARTLAVAPGTVEILKPVDALSPAAPLSTVEICNPLETSESTEAFEPAEIPRLSAIPRPTDNFERVEALEPAESAKPADARRSTEPVATVSPVQIDYSRTKTFALSRQLLEANRILDPSGISPASSAFRMLRTQVLQRMNEHQWRSLAVLSPSSEDGKTTTAINLAVSLANDHRHTVLLVEFDLKRPCIANLLGIAPEMGADDLLRGGAGLEDCLYHPDGFDRLVVLPARAPMNHSSEVLAGPWCRELVMQLRSRYPDRLLVFDLPPVLGADDALAFLPLVECALVVVAEGSTRRDDLVSCMELLRKTPVVGTVLNRASLVPTPYGR